MSISSLLVRVSLVAKLKLHSSILQARKVEKSDQLRYPSLNGAVKKNRLYSALETPAIFVVLIDAPCDEPPVAAWED